jgi:hypothetical protein
LAGASKNGQDTRIRPHQLKRAVAFYDEHARRVLTT